MWSQTGNYRLRELVSAKRDWVLRFSDQWPVFQAFCVGGSNSFFDGGKNVESLSKCITSIRSKNLRTDECMDVKGWEPMRDEDQCNYKSAAVFEVSCSYSLENFDRYV